MFGFVLFFRYFCVGSSRSRSSEGKICVPWFRWVQSPQFGIQSSSTNHSLSFLLLSRSCLSDHCTNRWYAVAQKSSTRQNNKSRKFGDESLSLASFLCIFDLFMFASPSVNFINFHPSSCWFFFNRNPPCICLSLLSLIDQKYRERWATMRHSASIKLSHTSTTTAVSHFEFHRFDELAPTRAKSLKLLEVALIALVNAESNKNASKANKKKQTKQKKFSWRSGRKNVHKHSRATSNPS